MRSQTCRTNEVPIGSGGLTCLSGDKLLLGRSIARPCKLNVISANDKQKIVCALLHGGVLIEGMVVEQEILSVTSPLDRVNLGAI